jgi:transcriptional regulator with XRE-family HTH domain
MVPLAHFHLALGLRALRTSRSVAAEALSQEAGLSAGEVDRIERGEIALDYLTAARLTNALNVGIAEIAVSAHQITFEALKRAYDRQAGVEGSCLAE